MNNPFEELQRQLIEIKDILTTKAPSNFPTQNIGKEIIDTDTLCKRLSLTEPTIIRHRKRGKIPFLQIGSAIRYDWTAVIQALENKKQKKEAI